MKLLRSTPTARASLALLTLATAMAAMSAAHAGPPEEFADIALHPSDPKRIVLGYEQGLAGLFVSSDGGKTFRIRNSEAVKLIPDTYFPRDEFPLLFSADRLLVGGSAGLLVGDTETCGLTQGQTLREDWVPAFAAHPTDPNVAFVVSNKDKAARGGLFRRSQAGELTALGPDHAANIDIVGLKVVTRAESSEQLRFVELGVRVGGDVGVPFLRYSDDLGASWIERALPAIQMPTLRLLAVDPLNADAFVVVGVTGGNPDPDDQVLLSVDAGKSFTPYGSGIKDARYATFAPDGRFWFGGKADGLYHAPRLGQPLTKVSERPVHCLAFDKSQDTLLLCNKFELGRFRPSDKSYCQMFRIYEATEFPHCAGETPLTDPRTKDQLCTSYCNATHYWYAEFCKQYDDVAAACGLGVLQSVFAENLPSQDDTPRCEGFPLLYVPPGSDAGVGDAGLGDAGGDDAGPADGGAHDASGGADAGASGQEAGAADANVGQPPAADAGVVPREGEQSDGCSCKVGREREQSGAWQLALWSVALLLSSRRWRARLGRIGLALSACAVLATQAGCDDDGNASEDGAAAHEDQDAGHEPPGAEPDATDLESSGHAPVACDPNTPRTPTAVEEMGDDGKLQAKIVEADHDPARKYQNDWVIALIDAEGQPVTDAVFTGQRTWMPAHGHDGTFAPTITPDASQPGRYVFEGVNFIMTGPWELQFAVSSASAGTDRFALDVCVGD